MTTAKAQKKKKNRRSQQGGSWKTLLFLILAAGGMAAWNGYSTRRDIDIANGPTDARQKEFFIEAADRPDIATLYKSMTPAQKIKVAENIGFQATTDSSRVYPYQSEIAYSFSLSREAKLAKLVAILLADFNADARRALTDSMAKLAKVEPAAVAFELKNPGSFQSRAVFAALKSLGDDALPYVTAMLSNGDARPQAVAYLVDAGTPSVPLLLGCLDSDNNDVRLAAVEALGKLRSRQATARLEEQYESKTDKLQYLTALASIGDPRSQGILENALDDPALDASMKAQAALGLGRIASPTSVARLWKLVPNPDVDLTDSTVAALQLAGDRSLLQTGTPLDLRLRVASVIKSDLADSVVRSGLSSPDKDVRAAALRVAIGRDKLAPAVAALLTKLDMDTQGDEADAAVLALVSTPVGLKAIEPMKSNPTIAALVQRREAIKASQS